MNIARESLTIAATLVVLLAQGCGGGGGGGDGPVATTDDDPTASAPPTDATAPESDGPVAPDETLPPSATADERVPARFVGTWQSDCRRTAGTFARSLAYIEPDRVASGGITYADAACTIPLQESRLASDTTYGATITLADGSEAVEIDVVLTAPVTLVARSDSVAASFSRRRLCGIERWATGVEYDVSDCDVVTDIYGPAFNSTARQINSLQGDELFVGRHVPTPEEPFPRTRPTELDYDFPFRRIEP